MRQSPHAEKAMGANCDSDFGGGGRGFAAILTAPANVALMANVLADSHGVLSVGACPLFASQMVPWGLERSANLPNIVV